MARWCDQTEEQKKNWEAYVDGLPPGVQELARQFPPYNLYRLRKTGQRVVVLAFCPDLTMHVGVSASFNMLAYEGKLVGIHPGDLEECDLPEEHEVGFVDDTIDGVHSKEHGRLN